MEHHGARRTGLDDPHHLPEVAVIDVAELLRLPLAGPLIELSNLQLPTAEEIDFAQAKFYIEGGVISFEQLGVSSQSVNLDGEGTLLWPSLELDLRVTSRGVRRAPIRRRVRGNRPQGQRI